jgi:hypothetical protein
MAQQLNDAQKKFLLIRRWSIVWKAATLLVVFVILYLVWTGSL